MIIKVFVHQQFTTHFDPFQDTFYYLFMIVWQLHICVKKWIKTRHFILNESVNYVHHERGDKLWVSDAQSAGRWFGEVQMKLLWAVRAGAGNSRGIIRLLSPALHGEGGLTLVVNVQVDAVVSCWSRAHGEIFGGSSDLPPAWEAVAGTGGFVRNRAAQQIRKTVTGVKKTTHSPSARFSILSKISSQARSFLLKT